MTNTLSPELIAKIEQEAEHYANVQIGEKAKFIQHPLSDQWDIAKEAYEDGYKAALQAAELQLEQMAKALEGIKNMKMPMSEAEFRQYVAFAQADAIKALTDYQTYKLGKDGTSQES